MGLLLPKSSKVKGFPTINSLLSLLSSFCKEAPRSAHECVRPERGEDCLGYPVFSVIPALATWGPLAPENRAPSSGFAPREGWRVGKPLPRRPGAAPFHQHLRAGECTTKVSGFRGMAVACLKASLFLGIVQNVSCGFSSSLLFSC